MWPRVGPQSPPTTAKPSMPASAGRAGRRPGRRGARSLDALLAVAALQDRPALRLEHWPAPVRAPRGSSSMADDGRFRPGQRPPPGPVPVGTSSRADRLDEVLGGAEREALPALVDHRHDHHGHRCGRRVGLQRAPAGPSRRAPAAGCRARPPPGAVDGRARRPACAVVGDDHLGAGVGQVERQQLQRAAVVLDDRRPVGTSAPSARRPAAGRRSLASGARERDREA